MGTKFDLSHDGKNIESHFNFLPDDGGIRYFRNDGNELSKRRHFSNTVLELFKYELFPCKNTFMPLFSHVAF